MVNQWSFGRMDKAYSGVVYSRVVTHGIIHWDFHRILVGLFYWIYPLVVTTID